MQPIIDLIKKLAFKEKKKAEAILCKIAVCMLYHSNRKASQLFQNFGENTEQLKFPLPMKQAIQFKTKKKLLLNSTK